MSKIVETKLGRFRAVTDGKKNWWLWECPYCKTWCNLSLDQMEGHTSVYCAAPVPNLYTDRLPDGSYPTLPCGYHQTHEFAKELATTVQARAFMGEPPFREDVA